jgi:hypothetical protein
VKGRYTAKHLKFTTSAEVRVALGVISQYDNPGWQNEHPKSPDIPLFPPKCSKIVCDRKLTWQQEMTKEDKNPKEDRKMRPETSRKQESAETRRQRTTTVAQNNRAPPQTKPMATKLSYNRKRRWHWRLKQ